MNVFSSNSHGKELISLVYCNSRIPLFYRNSPYLYLVNFENLYNKYNWSKLKMIKVNNIYNDSVLVEEKTFKYYRKLEKFVRDKLDVEIGIKYAYRNHDEQIKIYKDFCNKYGKEYADKVVCEVGCSEHHTGLSIDLEIKIDNIWVSNNEYPQITYPILEKIHPFLAEFGFILRFPKNDYNKVYTKISYEPWHIRFVGSKKIARFIQVYDITLEEFYYKYVLV